MIRRARDGTRLLPRECRGRHIVASPDSSRRECPVRNGGAQSSAPHSRSPLETAMVPVVYNNPRPDRDGALSDGQCW